MRAKKIAENRENNEIVIELSCEEKINPEELRILERFCYLPKGAKIGILIERPNNKRRLRTFRVLE